MASSSWEVEPGGSAGERSMDLDAWSEHVLNIAAERFERRLAEEISGLRVEMHAGFTAIRHELSEQRVELLKWSFAFWIGQLAAMTALLAFMLRNR
jgi:hypothetical protein